MCSKSNPPPVTFSALMREWKELLLLLILYTLQGIPLGLSSTIPIILEKRVSLAEHAAFSMVSLPFSLKLFWAPIIDGCYFPKIGRRKTWIIPTQILCGIILIWTALSGKLNLWTGETGEHPNILYLTILFIILYLLMASQDIAVDGWCLSLLSPPLQHVGATLNVLGQTLGYCISYVLFLILSNVEVLNKHLKLNLEKPLLNLSSFSCICGLAFIVTTVVVMVFFSEKSKISSEESALVPQEKEEEEQVESIEEVFMLAKKLFTMKPILMLSFVIFTHGICTAVLGSTLQLKLIHAGVNPSDLALLSPFFIVLSLLLPILINKIFDKNNQLLSLWYSMVIHLFLSFLSILSPRIISYQIQFSQTPVLQFLYVVLISLISSISSTMAFCSSITFFVTVADNSIGGTYITLLNTVSNASKTLIRPGAMLLVNFFDKLSIPNFTLFLYPIHGASRKLLTLMRFIYTHQNPFHVHDGEVPEKESYFFHEENPIHDNALARAGVWGHCRSLWERRSPYFFVNKDSLTGISPSDSICYLHLSGFEVTMVLSIIATICWVLYMKRHVFYLQSLSKNAWKVSSTAVIAKKQE